MRQVRRELVAVPGLEVLENEPLARHTRFGIGGPADWLVTSRESTAFLKALAITRESGVPWVVIGAGTNLVVADAGFRGVVLKLASKSTRETTQDGRICVDAGVLLQDLVDYTVAQGLRGLETMTGIPGWVGAAVYGNAGAYGHSIEERVSCVRFVNSDSERRALDNAGCEFRYRESIFKRNKNWIILDCTLNLEPADGEQLKRIADGILTVRNEKYPPTMKCAGSIFKNFLFADLPREVQGMLPGAVVREGKVPSAWFLEKVGAKGMRVGDIQVATYHANLIYNDGAGTAQDLVAVIQRLKQMVGDRFGIPLEEEVQYVGAF